MPTRGATQPDRWLDLEHEGVSYRVQWTEQWVPNPRLYLHTPSGLFVLGRAVEGETRNEVKARVVKWVSERTSGSS